MRPSETGIFISRSNKRLGFSLLELLIIIVIISVVMTFAVLTFGDFGKGRQVHMTTEHVQHILTFIREQAILDNTEYQMTITHDGFKVDNPSLPRFTTGQLPERIFMTFPSHADQTLIIHFYPSGHITPFTIDFGTTKQPAMRHLTGKLNGKIDV